MSKAKERAFWKAQRDLTGPADGVDLTECRVKIIGGKYKGRVGVVLELTESDPDYKNMEERWFVRVTVRGSGSIRDVRHTYVDIRESYLEVYEWPNGGKESS